jgi:hypothetical protein
MAEKASEIMGLRFTKFFGSFATQPPAYHGHEVAVAFDLDPKDTDLQHRSPRLCLLPRRAKSGYGSRQGHTEQTAARRYGKFQSDSDLIY